MITQWRGPTVFRIPLVTTLLLLSAAFIVAPAHATPSDLVISQVFGGGGNASAPYKNDFIELHNRGATTISLAGYSVQYASTAGTTWQVTNLAGSIPAGGYYLVQEAAGAGTGANLPPADASGGIPMSANNGKVALVSSTTALSGSCPTGGVLDFLGYGTANCFEGAGAGPALVNTTAAVRNASGCADTDNNATDFASGAVNPHNSASSAVSCQRTLTYLAGANGSISGTTPQSVTYGGNGSAVTAVADPNYHFVSWSDGVLTAARTDMNVQSDLTVTATFAINQHTLTYNAGANGSISGTTPQTVNHGADGTAVTAVPNAGYHFVNWSDGVLTATRTDTNVQGDISVTASFAINQYTLTYNAGANGSISGTTPQTVNHGADGTPVTAVPDANYHFVSWSDGVLTATRTDTNVQGDITVTASFAINQHTLTYNAGANGSISGTTPQTVNHGADGTAVTAVPNAGYRCVSWTDGVLTATRTDTNVQGNITVTASFAINQYTLTYNAGPNGSISGTTPQTVNHGASGTAVTAVPNAGYHFVSWSDGVLTAARMDMNVQGDITVTASFAINQYTLTYNAGPNGSISGTTPQTVNHGADGTAVTAVPNAGYHFVSWSDAVLTATRTDTNVQADLTVTASFAKNQVVVSQVYGGGGNVGALYTNDYIELYNRGSDPVDLTGWTVQYASASGSTWSSTALSGSIQPHKYILVQEAAGSGGSLALPTPDATGATAMSATAGKVALVNDATALSGTCPGGLTIEDLVGYGAANCSETSPAAALTNTTAEVRDGSGCVDTDNNSADLHPGSPNPHNSAAPANNCTFTLTVNVDPPASGSVSKSPDLASYASGASVQLTATPADGYHFDHWSGGATGSATPNNVTMNSDLVVTAHFLPNNLASQMVISQLYGGGGNSGASYTNDYVELYNRGNAPANITGWTIQYASATGTVWSTTTLIGVVPPGHYYQVKQASGGGGSTGLPAPDAIGTINLGAADGKLALVNTNVVLTGGTPSSPTIVDLLGYGAADFSESAPASAMNNTTATFRGHGGCDETNDNLADFASSSPGPRNSATPANICDGWLGVGPRPAVLSLSSPKPNPSHGVSFVSFGLPQEARVRLTVSDVMGRRVASLVDDVLPAGQHDVSWTGKGDGGQVRSGLYYFTLEVSGRRFVRSFVLVR